MSKVAIEVVYVEIDCATCSFTFAVPETFVERRRKDGRTFYRPAGGSNHPLSFGESEADKLRKQVEAKDRRIAAAEGTITHLRDQRDAADRSARAQKAANTRLRKRVANGVCPCCNRTFADVARHMANQHPEFETAEVTG